MSNKITKQILQNGSKSIITHYYFESDGVEGELNNYVLIDPNVDYPIADYAQAIVPNLSRTINLAICQVWYSFSWFDGLLAFGDLNNLPVWVLPRDAYGYFDFRYMHGLSDRSGPDETGQLLISTNGFAPAGQVGTLVIEARKHDPN